MVCMVRPVGSEVYDVDVHIRTFNSSVRCNALGGVRICGLCLVGAFKQASHDVCIPDIKRGYTAKLAVFLILQPDSRFGSKNLYMASPLQTVLD